METENIILWESDDGHCPIMDFVSRLPDKTKRSIFKRSEYYNQLLALNQFFGKKEFFEKIKGQDYALYELKYRINPPFRIVSFLWKDKIVALKMFQGSGSNGNIRKHITPKIIEMAEDWKKRFP